MILSRHEQRLRAFRALGILGAVAGAVGALSVPAKAADLLATKARPAYVKQCVSQGEGFYYIPGTDTCLRVGGYLWAEGYYNTYSDYPKVNDETYSIATLGLILDARTETEYGTLRSYMESRFRWRTADPWSEGPNGSELQLWNAYIQFAGFTFGHAQSFFDFYANADVLGTDPGTIGDDMNINLIAYTAEFSKHFSATISLEDAADRASGVYPGFLGMVDPADGAPDSQAGVQAPDIVGNLNYTGEWGSAQISGALHQVRAVDTFDGVPQLSGASDVWGYAVQGGLMFNLPMLGEGDTLWLQSAYTDGATSYLGLQDPSGQYIAPDAFISNNNDFTKVSGWNVTASLLHNWNAKWSTAVFGGYAAYEFNDDFAETTYGVSGGKNASVGGYIGFTPVKSLMLALQYDYTYNKANDYNPDAVLAPDRGSISANRVLAMAQRNF